MRAGTEGPFSPVEVRSLGYLLLAVLTARLGTDAVSRGVPFLPALAYPQTDLLWERGLSAMFFLGAALALSSRFFRAGCGIAGASLILQVLGNMAAYSNGRLFDGLLLLLIGLCATPRGVTLLRAQCLLLFTGASLSKATDPDWWNGRYMAAVFDHHLSGAWLTMFTPFATAMGLGSMFTEALIGALLVMPSTRNDGILLVAVFHTGMLLLLNDDFATFYYAVALSGTLLFIRIPTIRSLACPLPWLARHSVLSEVRRVDCVSGGPRVEFVNASLSGLYAWLFLALSNLHVLAAVLSAAALSARFGIPGARNLIMTLAVFTATAVGVSAMRSTSSAGQGAGAC